MNALGLIIASMEFSIVAGEAMKQAYDRKWLNWIVEGKEWLLKQSNKKKMQGYPNERLYLRKGKLG
jgi:hypothetical protein